MKIVLLQQNLVWADPLSNIRSAQALASTHPDADLYVLPEMWSTGFVVHPEEVAELESSSLALRWMQEFAVEKNSAICGSLAVRVSDGTCRNRHYFVTPCETYYYDKHHLFTHGNEHEGYVAGNTRTIVEWKGFRFLLETCYDLRFPVWSRYGWAGEYDAIIYVANWPHSRMDAWNVLVHARAIENQSYVIAVNRVGDDPSCHYSGGSMAVDPVGRDIAVCNKETEQSLVATLSIDDLAKARSRFTVLSDRDHPIV